MKNLPGTYALILACSSDLLIKIGKLGQVLVQPGSYIYAGSAFGPGGIKARIAHHKRIAVHPHWHIDYLSAYLQLNEIWYTYDSGHHEHLWASVLGCLKGASIPIAGFGASDCRCISHLYLIRSKPSVRQFRNRLCASLNSHGTIFSHKLK